MASLPLNTVDFALKRFHTNLESFSSALKPGTWINPQLPVITETEAKFSELKAKFLYWEQMAVVSASLEADQDASFLPIHSILDQCERSLREAHLNILTAKEVCETEVKSRNQQDKGVTQGQSLGSYESDFKLERRKPPQFNGNYTGWLNYSEMFRAAVIDHPKMPAALKLHHLKNSLVDKAASIADTFTNTNLSFVEAWDLVEKRFNKRREIVFAHLNKLFSMPAVSDNSDGILTVVDTINQCTRSLKMMNIEVSQWDVFIVYWAHLKLDTETRTQWLLQADDDLPELEEFLSFLEKRADALTSRQSGKDKSAKKDKSSHHTSTTSDTGKQKGCWFCTDRHSIYKCPKFLELTPKDRSAAAKRKRVCCNCLGGHTGTCTSNNSCAKCQQKHHTLLHFGTAAPFSVTPAAHSTSSTSVPSDAVIGIEQTPTAAQSIASANIAAQVGSHHWSSIIADDKVVLFATLVVNVTDSHGDLQPCRVFLDQGSEVNFVSESLVSRLGLRKQRSCVQITGIGTSTGDTARGMVTFLALSTFRGYSLPVNALVLPKLAGLLPSQTCHGQFPHLDGIPLADPNFYKSSTVDILLGAEVFSRILLPGLKVGPPGTPTAQNSKFGWFLTGISSPVQGHHVNFTVRACHSTCTATNKCLEASLLRFWELEEPSPPLTHLTTDDQQTESHFLRTFSRDPMGRFEISLPFLPGDGDLGESKRKAISCFKSLEKQLDRDPVTKEAYHRQIADYLSSDWVEVVPDSQLSTDHKVKVTTVNREEKFLSPFYLPHHTVVKLDNTTTKLRVVFNASAKTSSGNSLNSLLSPVPKIQTDLHPLLIRFRTHPVALCGDIVKFYNQILVIPGHCDFQRFLYRRYPSEKFCDLRFLRLSFGATSSPFLAIRVLRQLGEEFKVKCPLAYPATQNDFLVDNLLSGGSTAEEVLDLKAQLTEVLSSGQFPMQKWASNDPTVLNTVSPAERELYSFDLKLDDSVKTIGLYWHPASDTFGVKTQKSQLVAKATKREILSHIAMVFDPLQWLSPVTISGKIMLQSLWKQNLGWDDPIPASFLKKWSKYSKELELLRGFRVPRCLVFTKPSDATPSYDLLGFCDASNFAYAACVYLRSKVNNEVKVELIAAKSKVAPVGGETTPRLELCGAVLLTQLVNSTVNALTPTKIQLSSATCFTDSTGALGQLFSKDKQPVFVANRVRKIKNFPVPILWYHVPGEINPADPPSRGISPVSFLKNSELWLHGPPFLLTYELPPQPYPEFVVTFNTTVNVGSTYVNDRLTHFISVTSSFPKMKRLVAYWIRYKANLRKQLASGPLTVMELNLAELLLVKCVQSACLENEFNSCTNKFQSKDRLRFLPFWIPTACFGLAVDSNCRNLTSEPAIQFYCLNATHAQRLHRRLGATLCIVWPPTTTWPICTLDRSFFCR